MTTEVTLAGAISVTRCVHGSEVRPGHGARDGRSSTESTEQVVCGLFLPALFDPSESAAFLFLGGAHPSSAARWRGEPLQSSQLELLAGWWRRVVHVQLSRARSRHVGRFDVHDLEDSSRSAGDGNPDLVSGSHQTVGFPTLAVDLDPSALARLLSLGARLEQTRDVEPDVEADILLIAHGYEFRPRRTRGQATGATDRRAISHATRGGVSSPANPGPRVRFRRT